MQSGRHIAVAVIFLLTAIALPALLNVRKNGTQRTQNGVRKYVGTGTGELLTNTEPTSKRWLVLRGENFATGLTKSKSKQYAPTVGIENIQKPSISTIFATKKMMLLGCVIGEPQKNLFSQKLKNAKSFAQIVIGIGRGSGA